MLLNECAEGTVVGAGVRDGGALGDSDCSLITAVGSIDGSQLAVLTGDVVAPLTVGNSLGCPIGLFERATLDGGVSTGG